MACPLAEEVLGASTYVCPALEFEDRRHWCGLLRNAHRHLPGVIDKPWIDPYIRELLEQTGTFGAGCDTIDG